MKTLESFKELKKEVISSYRPRWQVTLNEFQLKEYRKLMYGLKAFYPEELVNLEEEEKRTIIYNNDKAWKLINRMKQEKMNRFLAKKIKKVFPNLTGEAVPFLTQPLTDANFLVNPNIKECNLSQEEMITVFIQAGLLPFNFLK